MPSIRKNLKYPFYIYNIVNVITNEVVYVGLTTDPAYRYQTHISESTRIRPKSPLYEYMSHVGSRDKSILKSIFKQEILDSVYTTSAEALKLESEYQFAYYMLDEPLKNKTINLSNKSIKINHSRDAPE